jgi:NADPH:quinone reductase
MTAPQASPYAVKLYAIGGPEVLQAEPFEIQQPGRDQVLVRNAAVGLNFIDTYFRSGLYKVVLPSGLGSEAAGVVEAVGSAATGFWTGDRVGYFTGTLGAYATHALVDQDRLVRLPDGIAFDQAAASMLKGCTAEYLIERCAKVQAGQTVLVHAAAGGVGSLLVQWLKAIGATVIAHSSSPEKAAIASENGAGHSLHGPMEELAGEVRSLTQGHGVPVVLDGVGADSWKASLDSVARRGLIVSYGNASGPVPPVSLLELSHAGSIYVTRPTLGDYCAAPEEMRASAERLFELMLGGKLKVRIGERFPLRQVAEAHRAIESRATTGSSVLIP